MKWRKCSCHHDWILERLPETLVACILEPASNVLGKGPLFQGFEDRAKTSKRLLGNGHLQSLPATTYP